MLVTGGVAVVAVLSWEIKICMILHGPEIDKQSALFSFSYYIVTEVKKVGRSSIASLPLSRCLSSFHFSLNRIWFFWFQRVNIIISELQFTMNVLFFRSLVLRYVRFVVVVDVVVRANDASIVNKVKIFSSFFRLNSLFHDWPNGRVVYARACVSKHFTGLATSRRGS